MPEIRLTSKKRKRTDSYNFTYRNINAEKNMPLTTSVTDNKEDDKGVYCFWTHKGGVGKTTSVVHLSLMLSRKQKKTIIIDCDPQLNSTMFFLANMNQKEDLYSNHNQVTIKELLEIAFTNTKLSETLNNAVTRINDHLDYISGSLDLFILERDIHLAETGALSPQIQLNILSSCKKLYEELRKNYDYIILDLNPSSSVINQLLICSSDYLIMPLTADIYCDYSINFIFDNILKWKERFNGYFPKCNRDGLHFPYLDVKIKGVSFNMFRLYDGKLPVAFQKKYDSISKQLVKKFEEDGGRNTYIRQGTEKTNIILGKIKQFNQLMPIYSERGIPIWDITKEMLKDSEVSTGKSYIEQISLYEQEFSYFCDNVFKK